MLYITPNINTFYLVLMQKEGKIFGYVWWSQSRKTQSRERKKQCPETKAKFL